MAAASNAPLDNDLTRLMRYVGEQHDFVNEVLLAAVNEVVLPNYLTIINSPTINPVERENLIKKYEYILAFVGEIRSGYAKIFKDLQDLQKSGNITNVTQKIEKKQNEFDILNRDLNKFIARYIKKGGLSLYRVTSQHTPLQHQEYNFKFYNASVPANTSIVRTKRTLVGTNNKNTTRNKNRLPSAFFHKNTRPSRGHININPVATLVRTYSLGSRGNTTHTSREISALGKIAKREIEQEYGTSLDDALKAFRKNSANAIALANQVRVNQQQFNNAQSKSVYAPNRLVNAQNPSVNAQNPSENNNRPTRKKTKSKPT